MKNSKTKDVKKNRIFLHIYSLLLLTSSIIFCHWNWSRDIQLSWWEEEDHGIVGVDCSTGAEMDHLAGAISLVIKPPPTDLAFHWTGLGWAELAPTLFIFHVMETLAAVMTKPLSIKHT